ncbi:MAG: hypothetical protein HY308_09090 [Gammaproteobacteria bacterium]|nr:hypothetical protein [Gammaproteobacteria bacterium]
MSTSSSTAVKEEKPEKVRLFRITDIPDVMDRRLGWTVAARVMRRWFAHPAYTMTDRVKLGREDSRNLSSFQLDERLVTMRWALRFSRVRTAY